MKVTALPEQYESPRRNKIHPLKFALWVGCASLAMMFGGFTSAYVVRQAAGNWLEFQMPGIFLVSTATIILSSITLQLSYYHFRRENTKPYRMLLVATFVLGVLFLVLQYMGWLELTARGVELRRNPAGDFVYLISGVHAAHVLGGLAVLAVALVHAFKLKKFTPKRKLRLELTLTYWHFVDLLWVYLVVFYWLQNR